MNILIKEFLGIESLSLDLQAPINIIVSENEAGKSSIRDAILWCLSGEARGLNTHQRQAALIRDGGKAAEVKIALPDGKEVFRRKTPKSPASVTGAAPPDAVLTAMQCDPMSFLSLPDDKRREILFRLLPGLNPTRKELGERLIDWLADQTDEKPLCDAVEGLAKLAASKGFKDAEQEAVTRRQVAKRLRQEARVEAPKPEAVIGGKKFILPDIQPAEVQAGLARLQDNRDALLQNRGSFNGELARLPDLEKELAALEGNPVDAPKPGEMDSLQTALEASRSMLAELQKQVDALVPGKAPKFYPAVCPAFPGSEIPCPKAGEVAISGQEAPDPAKAEKLRADFQVEREKVSRLEDDLQQAQARQKAFEEYPKKRDDLASTVARLKA